MTVEDGYAPTPPAVADYMAAELFVDKPTADDRILFPGAGTGCLAAAVRRYCSVRDYECPEAVAVDISRERLETFEAHVSSPEPETPPLSARSRRRLRPTYPRTQSSADAAVAMDADIRVTDFLLDPPDGEFDYIIANPPYSRYKAIDADKRDQYREEFRTATGQFPLYMPFVEQMQRLLADDGHLVFLAPVGYLLSPHASTFRKELRRDTLQSFMQLPEQVFPFKVETVVTCLTPDSSIGMDGWFWLESFVYESRVDDMLRDVGITDPDRREDMVEEYYRSYEMSRRMLDSKRQRKGEDAGYNIEKLPPEYRPGDSVQSDIGRWA